MKNPRQPTDASIRVEPARQGPRPVEPACEKCGLVPAAGWNCPRCGRELLDLARSDHVDYLDVARTHRWTGAAGRVVVAVLGTYVLTPLLLSVLSPWLTALSDRPSRILSPLLLLAVFFPLLLFMNLFVPGRVRRMWRVVADRADPDRSWLRRRRLSSVPAVFGLVVTAASLVDAFVPGHPLSAILPLQPARRRSSSSSGPR